MSDPAAPEVGPEDRHHLERVLRLRPGETVVATDGAGGWSLCRYTGNGRVLEAQGPVEREPAPGPPLTVAFAPLKGGRLEWVVQKLTEVGIDRIGVVATERSVVRWQPDRAASAMGRLARVAAEACAQSRRVWVPELFGPVPLGRLGESAPGVALAEPGGGPVGPGLTAIAVGPEGGWAADELGAARVTVGLGPHVLRADTAALVAGALLAAHRAGTVVAGS